MEYIAERLTRSLVKTNVVKNEDYEIYYYGIKQFMISILNVCLTLILGYMMGAVYQSIIYVISFMLIRRYAGGYHASTPVRCYVLTTAVLLGSLSAIKYGKLNIGIVCVVFLISYMIILILSPIGTQNKPLDEVEKIVYRKRTIIMLNIDALAAIFFLCFAYNEIFNCVAMAVITEAFSLIIGKLSLDYSKNFYGVK